MKNNIKKSLIVSAILASTLMSQTASAIVGGGQVSETQSPRVDLGSYKPFDGVRPTGVGMTAYDDPGCLTTKEAIETEMEKKRKAADEIRDKTATDPKGILDGLKTCVDGLGTTFNNPFSIPTNPWGNLGNSACNYITNVFSSNPLSDAVNNFSISDPTGTFSYNPSVTTGQNGGKNTYNNTLRENDISDNISQGVVGKLPGASDVWKGASVNSPGAVTVGGSR